MLEILHRSKSSHCHCKISLHSYWFNVGDAQRLTGHLYLAKVGLSGSGKSTLLNLLLRLYEPSSGQVNNLYLLNLVNRRFNSYKERVACSSSTTRLVVCFNHVYDASTPINVYAHLCCNKEQNMLQLHKLFPNFLAQVISFLYSDY